jgi:hypothetical protein
MPKSRPITKKELKAIKQSVLDARYSIRFWRRGLRRFPKAESDFTEIVNDERTLLLALRFDLGRKNYPLNSPVVKEIVQHALDTGNSSVNFWLINHSFLGGSARSSSWRSSCSTIGRRRKTACPNFFTSHLMP